jgi:hypothetical protein
VKLKLTAAAIVLKIGRQKAHTGIKKEHTKDGEELVASKKIIYHKVLRLMI